jgi:hypothetical protein
VQARQAEQRDRRAERETSCRRHDHDFPGRPASITAGVQDSQDNTVRSTVTITIDP